MNYELQIHIDEQCFLCVCVFSVQGSTSKVADKSEVEIIRYQVLIPVSEVQVRQIEPVKSPDGTEPVSSNYSWELVHLRNQTQRRSEKIYLLSNSTGEFRNAFLRNIRQIIRESVRNMSLPPRIMVVIIIQLQITLLIVKSYALSIFMIFI